MISILLIATDCISEGQNLQDCDWLINHDIHWNPVRIIQRFGRIDRIGSPNCLVPCDYMPLRSYPLFRAREVLECLAAEAEAVAADANRDPNGEPSCK